MIDYDVLKVIWWVLIGALLIRFSLTDGFDMGAGMLLPSPGQGRYRMVRSLELYRRNRGQPSVVHHGGRGDLRRLTGGLCDGVLRFLRRLVTGALRAVLQLSGFRIPRQPARPALA